MFLKESHVVWLNSTSQSEKFYSDINVSPDRERNENLLITIVIEQLVSQSEFWADFQCFGLHPVFTVVVCLLRDSCHCQRMRLLFFKESFTFHTLSKSR